MLQQTKDAMFIVLDRLEDESSSKERCAAECLFTRMPYYTAVLEMIRREIETRLEELDAAVDTVAECVRG